MDPKLAGIDELLDYAVGNLTEDLIGLIQKAHNLTMDRFYDRQKVLKQFNAEKGLSLSSLLLSSVAQLVERWFEAPVVASSILAGGTK